MKDTTWEFELWSYRYFSLTVLLALFGGLGKVRMQEGCAGGEEVTLQASKLFIDPLDEEERNLGLIPQGETSASLKSRYRMLVLANVPWQ